MCKHLNRQFIQNIICESCSVMSDSLQNSPGQNTGVGSLFLLQGIFPTQGSNPGLPHCRQILYHLSYQGSPQIIILTAKSSGKMFSIISYHIHKSRSSIQTNLLTISQSGTFASQYKLFLLQGRVHFFCCLILHILNTGLANFDRFCVFSLAFPF